MGIQPRTILKNKSIGCLSLEFARGFSVILMMAATALSSPGCSTKTDSDPQTPGTTAGNVTLTAAQRQNIQLDTVAPSKFQRTIETTATVDFDNDRATSVLAPISGPVSRLLVSPGDKVAAGDPLAAVDSPDFAAAISAYRKAIATARTARRLADLDKDLSEHQGIAQRESEQAQTDAANAEADREAALQTLVSLNVRPQTIKDIQEDRPFSRPESLIRSPIAGTVAERLITPGQLLQAGTTPCFTIADLSRMWVMAQVFGSDVASVSLGDSAEVVTGMGSTGIPGTVDNIAALVDPDTRSVLIRVLVENPARLLKKQMYVHVSIHARQESTAILIPNSAILRDDENLPFVYETRSDGSFARQPVTLGYHADDQVEISTGLAAGDQIVVDGGIFVQFIQSQ
jgi:cobalt-zinc-cadmium efflux system membrane fusion protein